MTTQDFENTIIQKFIIAEAHGLPSITFRAGDLHSEVGGYPESDHRMPCCCNAMHNLMKLGDREILRPPSGTGANLTIEYLLPRKS